MIKEQFEEITKWQGETFPKATSLSMMAHLFEEVKEYNDALYDQLDDRELELADCLLLLFGCAAKDGMSYEDICSAIKSKMDINRGRTWGKPNANGVVNHVKDGE